MDNSNTSLADIAAVAVGAVGVVATLVLTILGVLVALQFWKATKRLEEIEHKIGEDRQNFYGLGVFSEVMFGGISRITSVIDIQRRAIEDLVVQPKAMTKQDKNRYLSNFDKRISTQMEELNRVSLCFRAMMITDTDDSVLEALVSHFPDYRTYLFLDALAKTRSGDVRDMLELEAHHLEKTFRGNAR
jgi:hypothetical protein